MAVVADDLGQRGGAPERRENAMPGHEVVHTDGAPAALGPYSQATTLPVGDKKLVFVSGQIAIDPATGEVVDGPVEAQVRRVMQNIAAVLEAAGSSLSQVLKATIFLVDMEDFATCNQAYGAFFDEAPPARATVQVGRLPKDVQVEIEVVAYG